MGPTYVDNWVRLRLSENPRIGEMLAEAASVKEVTTRLIRCLPCFPWLRGLGRVIQVRQQTTLGLRRVCGGRRSVDPVGRAGARVCAAALCR
jgi:hypothetical protein